MKQTKLITTVLIVAIVLIFLIASKGLTDFSRFSNDYGTKVKFDLYVMSQCPYGVQAENEVFVLMNKLGKYVDLNVEYIGNVDALQSLHGENEVKGDIIQLCVKKYYDNKFVDFLKCQNQNFKAIPNNWQSCANNLGFDLSKLDLCYSSNEGVDLVKASFTKSNNLGVSGSPTIYISSEEYSGARDSLSFMISVCSKLGNVPECGALPECEQDTQCKDVADKEVKCINNKCIYSTPVPFTLIIVNDKTCSSCDVNQIAGVFKKMFKGVDFKTVDINTEEGKKYIADYKIIYVPAYIASNGIAKTNLWNTDPKFSSYFRFINSNYYLSNEVVGSRHFVDDRMKEQYMKGLNITLNDNKPQIDFFVMSFCPYGNQVEEMIYEVYKNIGNKADFKPHYVFYSGYQGGGSNYCFDSGSKYCSMHGVQEANQDIRELCVNKDYGIENWFKFVSAINKQCSSSNVDSCWSSVATSLGFDVEKIQKCYNDKKLQFGNEQLSLASLFGASGSPAVYIDGEEYNGARSAAGYQSGLCSAFDTKPIECNNKLSEPVQTASVNSNAGCGV